MLGLLRSLAIYWRPGRQRGLRRLYAPFVGHGDLVFDVGAHLGDRAAAFAALGARVVALEPQPVIRRWLTRLVGRNPRVTVRPEALGRRVGTAEMAVSRRTPAVSTLAAEWRRTVGSSDPGFRRVRWEDRIEVPVLTLDALIGIYGTPRFCKIDVEGYEAEVLAGLSAPVPGVSVEFITACPAAALGAIRHLSELAPYEFNAIKAEERRFVFGAWTGREAVEAWLRSGAEGVASGDVYARIPGRSVLD
jgi:FkbM family methyltransferase